MRRRVMSGAVLMFTLVRFSGGPVTAQSPRPSADALSALKFRYIGPVGNRVIAIAGVPGSPHIYYAGAASGGRTRPTSALSSAARSIPRLSIPRSLAGSKFTRTTIFRPRSWSLE